MKLYGLIYEFNSTSNRQELWALIDVMELFTGDGGLLHIDGKIVKIINENTVMPRRGNIRIPFHPSSRSKLLSANELQEYFEDNISEFL